jgi:hypothetical protein
MTGCGAKFGTGHNAYPTATVRDPVCGGTIHDCPSDLRPKEYMTVALLAIRKGDPMARKKVIIMGAAGRDWGVIPTPPRIPQLQYPLPGQ